MSRIQTINTRRARRELGFTLIEISVVMVIIASLLGGTITLLVAALDRNSYRVTQQKFDYVQQTILNYFQSQGYLPCPASLTAATSSATYGVGTGSGAGAANCSAATFTSGNVAIGAVPVKTLGLKDEFAIDGWGRRFYYVVDTRTTVNKTILTYDQTSTAVGNISVEDDQGVNRTTIAVYLMMSAGSNGHGAYTTFGGSTRFNAGVTHADELENCDCNSSGVSTGTDSLFVQQIIKGSGDSSSFDDEVRYVLYRDINT